MTNPFGNRRLTLRSPAEDDVDSTGLRGVNTTLVRD